MEWLNILIYYKIHIIYLKVLAWALKCQLLILYVKGYSILLLNCTTDIQSHTQFLCGLFQRN